MSAYASYLYRVPLDTGGATVTGAAEFTGTGTLTVATTTIATASTTFTGAGTLTVNANVIPANAVTFTGEGFVNANAVRVAQAQLSPFAGTGSLTLAARIVRRATIAYTGTGTLNVVSLEAPDMYTPGPCEPWDPIWGTCLVNLTTEAQALTGTALAAASEILWALTAQRFGLCRVQLRPCRTTCVDQQTRGMWWEFGTYPYPALIAGAWFNLGCAGCAGSCSCTDLQETMLPGPVAGISEVTVDGTVLSPSAYQVHDYRKLVRTDGGTWPLCNNFTLPTTEAGTWSVTADYGEPVPVTGRIAVGELACEIARSLAGQTCALPSGLQQVTRQGVSMTFNEYTEILDNGLVGLPHSDRFIKMWNPHKLMARGAVYDLDGGTGSYRQAGL